ncbi:MAG: hypothetical protein D6705_18775 [Deltaproteobacteria bacterium]|nr:MAG: hypothetical protein D6705_18775 [Deltaproteobacteria bacterium]
MIAAGRGGGVARTWGMLRSKTTLVAAAAAIALAWGACVWGFGVPAFVAFVAVALAALLVPIAVRVTGETDVTPSGPLGKLAQLVAGIVAPGAPAVGVAAAGISAGAATAAGELMTDLRLGRDLGAEPRTQAVRQAAGLLLGIACVVPVYLWGLVPDPAALGGADVPVPAAQVWRAVAALLAGGLAVLPAGAAEAFLVAVTAATVATWAGVRMPRIGRWIPSFVGVGLGCVLPPMTSMGFAVGGLAVAAVRSARWRRGLGAAAAGALAGEGVASVLFGFLGHLA